jgi:uncharacterized protein (DUF362 family)
MTNFLNILLITDGYNKRDLNSLASVYLDNGKLEQLIEETVSSSLVRNDVEGKKVLLKPNWVRHSIIDTDEICLRTNDNFILAVLSFILRMRPSQVVIGDAPIQGCDWDRMITESFYSAVKALSDRHNIPVSLKDFRRRTFNRIRNEHSSEIHPLSDYVIVDLEGKSMLEAITQPGLTKFRVTDYDPDRMTEAHSPGVHKYCITKEFLDADILISIPKIKTHQKTGITGALKNIVGINGDKDFLPHHRIGGVGRGGDCYPGDSMLRYLAEMSLDHANRLHGKRRYWIWQKISSLFWLLSFPSPEHSLTAGWYGNDTTWRMVTDLNIIAVYCTRNGVISDTPQRTVYSICDGIVAGQGDGPLQPCPLPLGVISFSNDSLTNDRAMALLMGISPDKVPLLSEQSLSEKQECLLKLNGTKISMEDLHAFSIIADLPPGWKRYNFQR